MRDCLPPQPRGCRSQDRSAWTGRRPGERRSAIPVNRCLVVPARWGRTVLEGLEASTQRRADLIGSLPRVERTVGRREELLDLQYSLRCYWSLERCEPLREFGEEIGVRPGGDTVERRGPRQHAWGQVVLQSSQRSREDLAIAVRRELSRPPPREARPPLRPCFAAKLPVSTAAEPDEFVVAEGRLQRSADDEDAGEHDARERPDHSREAENERKHADRADRQSGTERPRQAQPFVLLSRSPPRDIHVNDGTRTTLSAA
jgi:hypothetical protein